jgi:hypothetical protein
MNKIQYVIDITGLGPGVYDTYNLRADMACQLLPPVLFYFGYSYPLLYYAKKLCCIFTLIDELSL